VTLPLRPRRGLIHNERVAYSPEVSPLAENQPISFADSIREARQRLAQELRAQAGQIQKLNVELTELQQLQERTEQEASRQWDGLTRAAELAAADAAAAEAAAAAATAAAEAAAAAEPQVSPDAVLEDVLGAVRGLMTCTIPEQVFEVVTEEASQWGVRAAIFDVRGKAAWGASARGFGPALSEKVLRSLIVPLNQDNPFRQVCETAGHVDASAVTLKKNRNVLDKLKPAPHAPVLLLPIRSAGTVTAIFYADPGEKGQSLPVNALKILAEFAGAQIDRLIALSGDFSADEVDQEVVQPAGREVLVEEAPVEVAAEEPAPTEAHAEEPVRGEAHAEEPAPAELHAEEAHAEEPAPAELHAEEPHAEEPAVEQPVIGETIAEVHTEVEVVEPPVLEPEPPAPPVEVAVEPPEPVAPAVASKPAPPVVEQPVEVVPPPPPIEPPPPVTAAESIPPPPPAAPAGFDVSQLSEAEQKVHKDAKRFAKLLVSEIELYNKPKVADGRKNRDLYRRLKSDIDRSRQTFEKRFGKVLNKQFDYLHEELVKTLAANDSTVLGAEYPGPTA
jgi:hypothetical protein